MQRVTIVGGAGDMARVVARDLLARRSTIELVLADRDVAKAQRVAAALGVPDLRVLAVDVFEPVRVREVIHGSALFGGGQSEIHLAAANLRSTAS